MITESLRYLSDSDEWLKTTLVGGILLLFGWLLIPMFVAFGYMMRVLDRTSRGDDVPPVFEDWGALTVEGFKAWLIGLVYVGIPMLAVGAVLASVVGIASFSDNAIVGALGSLVALVLFLVSVAVLLLAAYVTPAAVANFVDGGRLGDGFAFKTIYSAVTKRDYAVGWLIGAAILVVASVVASALNIVPILGTILGVFVTFYASVAFWYVIGHTWMDVRPVARGRDGLATSEQPVV